jgi:hypothetical protein
LELAPVAQSAVAEDLATGRIDRFRSLPIAASAVLAGRIAADAIRNLLVIGLIIGVGSVLGFRFHADPAAALACVATQFASASPSPRPTRSSDSSSATPSRPAWPASSR